MSRNKEIAIQILEEIDRARSGNFPLEELEQKLWRLIESADEGFPLGISGRVEDMVLELQNLKRENLSGEAEADENRGSEVIYNEVTGAIARYLG
jgi:hypothetical protein